MVLVPSGPPIKRSHFSSGRCFSFLHCKDVCVCVCVVCVCVWSHSYFVRQCQCGAHLVCFTYERRASTQVDRKTHCTLRADPGSLAPCANFNFHQLPLHVFFLRKVHDKRKRAFFTFSNVHFFFKVSHAAVRDPGPDPGSAPTAVGHVPTEH